MRRNRSDPYARGISDGLAWHKLFETRLEDSKFKDSILRNNGNRFHWDYITGSGGPERA